MVKSSAQPLVVWSGQVAQLVEQWTENPCVAGSIPALTTKDDGEIPGFQGSSRRPFFVSRTILLSCIG